MTEENTKNETSFLNEIAAEAAKIAASLSAISESNATEITDCACAAKKNGGTAAGLCLFENTIKELLEEIRSALFPDIFCCTSPEKSLVSAAKNCICTLLSATGETRARKTLRLNFSARCPKSVACFSPIFRRGYRGDPAAKDEKEIALCYPCFYALTVHRLAHFLYAKNIPVLPRMMSEIAHSRTGIDIHPGAKIGEYFFIDHWHGRRHRRNGNHRQKRKTVSGRNHRREEFQSQPRRLARQRREASSGYFKRRSHLRQRVRARRQYRYR